MNFRTKIDIKNKTFPQISHQHKIMSLGSCFSENIGYKLLEAKFDCLINPYGVLYNPSSISKVMREIMEGKEYKTEDLFQYGADWHSWMHHGSFSTDSPMKTLQNINRSLIQAQEILPKADYLLITFGTAGVYKLKQTAEVVSNCHRVPSKLFVRERLSVSDIVKDYKKLLTDIFTLYPRLKVVMSVSPIRHLRDGMHENQLSKSVLLLAINELKCMFPHQIYYFPSYEIVLDELRDYRFYAKDMVHPSDLAIDYIWQLFKDAFFVAETHKIVSLCEEISKSLQHRPSNPKSPVYRSFLEHLVDKMQDLSIKYPNLEFRKEISRCHIQLKKL